VASLPNPCINSACGARGTSVRRSAGVVPGRSARGERPCARRCAGTGRVRPRLLLPPSARCSAPALASHLTSFPRVSGPASFLTSASARALARILQAPTPPRAREPRKGSDRGDGDRDAQRRHCTSLGSGADGPASRGRRDPGRWLLLSNWKGAAARSLRDAPGVAQNHQCRRGQRTLPQSLAERHCGGRCCDQRRLPHWRPKRAAPGRVDWLELRDARTSGRDRGRCRR
jgi:hypothetical protein